MEFPSGLGQGLVGHCGQVADAGSGVGSASARQKQTRHINVQKMYNFLLYSNAVYKRVEKKFHFCLNIPAFIVHTDVLPEQSSSPSSPVDDLPRNQLSASNHQPGATHTISQSLALDSGPRPLKDPVQGKAQKSSQEMKTGQPVRWVGGMQKTSDARVLHIVQLVGMALEH